MQVVGDEAAVAWEELWKKCDEKMKALKSRDGGIHFGGKKAAAVSDDSSSTDGDDAGDEVELGQIKPLGLPRPKDGWTEKMNAREKYGGGRQNR